jgi:DNA-binding transcriptional MerR regulator
MKDGSKFSIDDMVRLTTYPKRTIRYYVQFGLLDHPLGEGRASHYTIEHLRQLLEIKRLSEYGLSLDAIKTRLQREAMGPSPPPPLARKPGSIRIQSNVFIAPGIEIIISPDEIDLSPDEIRILVKGILEHIRLIFEERELTKKEKEEAKEKNKDGNASKSFHKITVKNLLALAEGKAHARQTVAGDPKDKKEDPNGQVSSETRDDTEKEE